MNLIVNASLMQLPGATAQQAAEGLPERDIAQSVAAGVDGAVDVTQPVARRPQGVGDTDVTKGGDERHDVVGRPGDDECQQDGKNGVGQPPLPHHHSAPPPLLRPEAGTGGQSCRGRAVEVRGGRGVFVCCCT